VSKRHAIFGLHAGVALSGIAATTLALLVAIRTLSLSAPSTGQLLQACRSFVLPQLTVASLLALALGSVAFAVLGLAGRSALRQLRASRRFLDGLRVRGWVPGHEALLFWDERPLAFCAGLIRPRVYVSTGAVAALETDELDAVLAHEAHHARYRDPLRILFARVLSDCLFFLPVLRRLSDRYAALAELAADAAAVRHQRGDPQPLAAALLAFDERASSAVVAIAPERVDHLLGERIRWELPIALLAWAIVAVLAIGVVAVRTAQATEQAMVSLPLVAAHLCMVLMAALPLAVGGSALIGVLRLRGGQRVGR
jgi:Zn-dependent protease with chaperone function